MVKTRMDITIDTNLKKIMKKHCRCNNTNMSMFIATAIADKLQVPLINGIVDEDAYIKAQIKEVDNCMSKLEAQKRELEAQL